VTTTLPASGLGNATFNCGGSFYSADQSDGTGQEEFARELQDVGQFTTLGISPKKVPHPAVETGPATGKKEPGEPSATCLAVVPFVPLPQQTLPIRLEFPLHKGFEKPASTFVAGTTAWTVGTAPNEHPALAAPLTNILQPPSDLAAAKSQPLPLDEVRLPPQVGTPATPTPQAGIIATAPEMPQPEELTVAVRLKAQNTQAPAGAKAVPVKEPHRIDVDAVPAVQPVRGPAFQATAWNSPEGSTSGGQHPSLEKTSAPPEHLDAAVPVTERPTKVVEPLRNLSIQVGQANQEKVELRVTERAGEVHVAVRTADVDLQNGLRQSLPELVHRLEGQGYRADAWRPAGVVSAATPVTEARQSSPDFQRGDSQSQQGWSQQERGQHDHNHSQRPQWVEELEGNLAGDGNRQTGEFHGYIR
jgi:hypothetical protein